MKNWCKHFFGSFFVNKFAIADSTSGIMNTLLAFFIGFFLMILSLFGGFTLSFGTMYENSADFKKITEKVFTAIEDYKIENDRLVTEKVINTFDNANDEEYGIGGYSVIVDTRTMETTFVGFEPYYVNSKDSKDKIGEEQYNSLSADGKKQYSFGVDLNGNVIDTVAGIPDYEEYYKNIKEDDKKNYNELQEKKSELSEKEYADNLYVIYTVSKYPEIVNVDSYSYAPTLRTYYLKKITTLSADKYLAVFDNGIFGCFETDKGISVDFAGNVLGLKNSGKIINAENFIRNAFRAAAAFNFNYYFVNSFKIIGFMALCYAVCVLISFAVCRFAKIEFGNSLSGNIAAVGAFVLFSALFAGIVSLCLSFALNRYVMLNIAPFIFGGILLIRTIVLLVCSYIKQNNEDEQLEDDIF